MSAYTIKPGGPVSWKNYVAAIDAMKDAADMEVQKQISELRAELARKDAALREADEAIHDLIEAQPYPRGRDGALEELRKQIRSALTPATETGETK